MSSFEILTQLRGIFPHQSLKYLKKAAAYFKNDPAGRESFVRNAVETRHFPELPNVMDAELEARLQVQFQFLKEFMPDAEDEYVRVLFESNAATSGLEIAALDAVTSQSYPRKKLPSVKEVVFDVKSYCELVPNPLGSFSHANYIMTDNMKSEAIDYLVKIFGEDKRANIAKHVNKEECLYLAYRKMRESGGEPNAQVCRDSVKTVQPKTFDEAPDYLQTFEKLLIENEGVILSYLEKKRVDEEKLYNVEKSLKSLTECMICCKNTVSIKIIKVCEGGHLMCFDCVKEHTELLFYESSLFFQCAFNCELYISNSVIRSVWDTSRYSKLLEERIFKDKKDAIVCPSCNFGNEQSLNLDIICGHCRKKFCISCKKSGHAPAPCHKRENDLCKKVEEEMTEALIRKCPNCKTPFIKEEACCNRVRCVKCNVTMCYVCRVVVAGSGYSHFYGQGVMPSDAPGKCPLNSDINNLHVYNVIKTGTKALEKVHADNPGIQLLYNPLAKPPVPGKSDSVPYQY